jgi:hypothetical protein
MPVLARIAFAGISALLGVACASSSEPTSAGASAETAGPSAEASGASCNLIAVRFETSDLLQDLQKTLAPEYSHGAAITVPGSIVADGDGDAFTNLVTVMDARVSFYAPEGSTVQKSILEISGGFPDTLHGDRAAHRLYDAMTRGVQADEWHRVSKDGNFECHEEGWKGGTLYICTFPGVIDVGGRVQSSPVCAN